MCVFHNDKKRHEQVVFSVNSVGGENIREVQGNHPTPKPVELIENVFKKLGLSGIVIDLFLGSGSTLIAAEKTKNSCYGMELDPHYIDVIIKRYIEYTESKDNCYLIRDGNKMPLSDIKEQKNEW